MNSKQALLQISKEKPVSDVTEKLVCGVVMPISAIDGCAEAHWSDVYEIFSDAVEEAGFEANLVSNADDVGIIHKRIIQNLYDNPIVVCDVSGKNPNVMFELGLRLAFDKPTIIVKDDKTTYSFDTSAIEHLEYPRDLRFARIVEFKQKLAEKIRATHARATVDKSYTTFLKHFGEFTVAKLDKKEVSGQEYILEELKAMRVLFEKVTQRAEPRVPLPIRRPGYVNMCMRNVPEDEVVNAARLAEASGVSKANIENRGPNHSHIIVHMDPEPEESTAALRALLRQKSRIRSRGGNRVDAPLIANE